jgi:hypothetical protein
MNLQLTEQECEQIFHTALCNGLQVITSYGLDIDTQHAEYKAAICSIQDTGKPNEAVCYEDILLEILKNGGTLKIVDIEGEGENDSTINIKDVYERMHKVNPKHIIDVINEWDDAETADCILQTIFYNEIIFA